MDTQSLLDLVLDDVVQGIQFGRSVLVQAALQGHEDVLRYLLHRINSSHLAPSPDQPELGKALSDAFLGAAKQGHSRCLSTLLESGGSLLNIDGLMNATNELGETALMVAAKDGRGHCAKIILQHNPEAQVAAMDHDKNTALMWAAWGGHGQCVSQLLQHNPEAQVVAADKYGSNALMSAACGGHAECVTHLLQHNPEAQAAAANEDGDTALIFAARNGHAECVSQLLQHNPQAQVVAMRIDGDSALVAAVRKNHPGCVALILAYSPSAQIATVDGGGHPVVETAALLGHPQCLDLLLAHDPQPQHLDTAWLSALQGWDAAQARTSPHTQCLERLNASGALLPASAQEADRAKNRLFFKDFGSRALVADRVNEAIVGLALNVRGSRRKAGQGEQE